MKSCVKRESKVEVWQFLTFYLSFLESCLRILLKLSYMQVVVFDKRKKVCGLFLRG